MDDLLLLVLVPIMAMAACCCMWQSALAAKDNHLKLRSCHSRWAMKRPAKKPTTQQSQTLRQRHKIVPIKCFEARTVSLSLTFICLFAATLVGVLWVTVALFHFDYLQLQPDHNFVMLFCLNVWTWADRWK